MVTAASRSGLCEVCSLHEAQYKCPRCGVFSCSLTCCKAHKTSSLPPCSGVRDRAKFILRSQFDASDLKKDYHFLEDVLQTKQSAKRLLDRDVGGNPLPIQNNNNNNNNNKNSSNSSNSSKRSRRAEGQTEEEQVEEEDGAASNIPTVSNILVDALAAPVQDLRAYGKGVKNLVNAARQRGTHLVLMPPGMSKRALNTSSLNTQQNRCVFDSMVGMY